MSEESGPAATAAPQPLVPAWRRLAALPLLALPLTLLLWALAQPLGLWRSAEQGLQDGLLRASAGSLQAPELALVDIDDASLRALQGQLGDWPYPRSVYALVQDYARSAGVRLLVYDLVLSGARPGDSEFAEALVQGPPAVLAAAGLEPNGALLEPRPEELALLRRLPPLPPRSSASLRWNALILPAPGLLAGLRSSSGGPQLPAGSLGLISAPLDADGLLRQLPLWHQYQGQVLPTLPLAALLRESLPLPELAQDSQGRVLPKWPARLDGMLRLSWAELMAGVLGQADDAGLRASLRGRVLFIGSSAFFADAVNTPQGRWSGSALMAASYALLARGQVLSPAGPLWNGLLLLLAAAPALWASRAAQPAWRQLGWSTAMAALLLLALALGLLQWQLLLPELLAPLLLLVFSWTLGGVAAQRWQTLRHRQLRQEREMAEAANQAKTRILAHVSHEIRTPMNAVLGMAEILSRTSLDADQRRYVELFRRAGDQLFELINDLLDNAKIEAGRLQLAPQVFDLGELLEHQLELLRPRADGQGLWLRLELAPEARGWVWGDAQRVSQVLVNLVGNAIKFTRAGGVDVRAWRDRAGLLCLSVQDTGIGIDPAQHQRIFQAYSQAESSTAREFGGTGLGLSITRSLVQMMGGEVQLSSAPGQGSRFELSLDLPPRPAPAQPQSGPARAGLEPGQPQRPLNLLLCEDNEVNVLVIEAMLRPLGHRIERAADGQQALDLLQRQGQAELPHFDLVLMDLQMPLLDGLSVTRQWRAQEAERAAGGSSPGRLPIVALTANAFASDVQQSLESGCDAHLSKPISRQALLQALARWARA